jgi:hypothetical protein
MCKVCFGKNETCQFCSKIENLGGKRVAKGYSKEVLRMITHKVYLEYYKTQKAMNIKYNKMTRTSDGQIVQSLIARPFTHLIQNRYFAPGSNDSLPFGHYELFGVDSNTTNKC